MIALEAQTVRDRLLARLAEQGIDVAQWQGELGTLLDSAAKAGATETVVLSAVADVLEVPFHESIAKYATSADFVGRIPISFSRQHKVLGLTDEDGRTLVAVGDLRKWKQVDVVARFLNRPVVPILAPQGVVESAINEAYQQKSGQAQAFIEKLDRGDVLDEVRQLAGREDLLDNASRAPIIKLVNLMLFDAVKAGASDVHVQPYEDRLVVRMRIDGLLFDSFELPKGVQEEVLSRVKVMGKMNIAEKRIPQDGRTTVQVGDKTVDLRIASLPTSHGERIVIRLLDKSARLYRLHEIGMDERILRQYKQLITVEHGLILVTGPTGSGKSTTLYSALKEINSIEKNILTLEDPIEYQLDGISQTQVSEKKGMTFAAGLRSVLRQDPDIIMVGEVRDRETAVMAIQSALTGHLVFSTLHTNDAASAVTRLLDLGIEPYLVASSVIGVLAQRLVRRVCPHCVEPYSAAPEELVRLGLDFWEANNMKKGRGCENCRNTGYRGRLGIFELMTVTDAVRRHIQSRGTAAEIRDAGIQTGMATLRDDGINKVVAGITTIEEVERVTMRSVSPEETIEADVVQSNGDTPKGLEKVDADGLSPTGS